MSSAHPLIFAVEVKGRRAPADITENELTSRVLGLLGHLSAKAQMTFLTALGLLDDPDDAGLSDITFWPRLSDEHKARELDAIVRYASRRIGFEFKWGTQGDSEQLEDEWLLLNEPKDKLAYVTRGSIRPNELDEAERKLGLRRDTIVWIPWSKWLREAYVARNESTDSRDTRLLDELIGLLEVLGVSDWDQHLAKYWATVGDEKVVQAFTGLKQYFENLRAYLVSRHGGDYKVGQPTTVFPEKSYVELTPKAVASFDSSLGIWVMFHHRTQEWSLTLEGTGNLEPLIRAWRDLGETSPENIELMDPRKNDYVVAERSFKPSVGFEEPDKLRDEIEHALLSFGNDITLALTHH